MIKKLLNIAICLIFLTPSTVQAQQEPYRVALMVPLYLDQVDDAFLGRRGSEQDWACRGRGLLGFARNRNALGHELVVQRL